MNQKQVSLGEAIMIVYRDTKGINPRNRKLWNPFELLEELRNRKLVNEYCTVLDVAEEGDRVMGSRQ